MSIPAPPTEKPKHTPDLDLTVPLAVESCAERLENLADEEPGLMVDVALMPKDGQWDVLLVHSEGSPYDPRFTRVRFVGHLSRSSTGGAHLAGAFLVDAATYVTRALYLTTLGPLLLFIALRLGGRLPVIWLLALGGLAVLFYLLAWQPDRVLRERSAQIKRLIESALR